MEGSIQLIRQFMTVHFPIKKLFKFKKDYSTPASYNKWSIYEGHKLTFKFALLLIN